MCATFFAQNLSFSSRSHYCSLCDSLYRSVLLYIVQCEVFLKKTLQGARSCNHHSCVF